MPIKAGDVVWLLDQRIREQNRKRMVCVAPKLGLFFRINTNDYWPVAVPIDAARHPFLHWDSYIECSLPLEFDDYDMDMAAAEGVIGRIHPDIVGRLWTVVLLSDEINAHIKRAIKNAFQIP